MADTYPPHVSYGHQPPPPMANACYPPPPGYQWFGASPHDSAWSTPYHPHPWAAMGHAHASPHHALTPMMPLGPNLMQQNNPGGLRLVVPEQKQQMMGPTQHAPLPSSPRGPPCKPRQSGWAMWVGNLSPSTTIIHLKDFFSTRATDDIESVFLITKTNCAFVNYKTETACVEAVQRFDSSQFRGNRLVCRVRRCSSSSQGSNSAPLPSPSDVPSLSHSASSGSESESASDTSENPLIVAGDKGRQQFDTAAKTNDNESPEALTPDLDRLSLSPKVRTKIFILKSLTLQDLLVSTRDGAWVTQPHNEHKLNDAFRSADNVYLLFSVNKSGQYFGYARMDSAIPLSSTISKKAPSPTVQRSDHPSHVDDVPLLIPTPATATAPKGHVVDDSGRGTIFWEAESASDVEDKDAAVGSEAVEEDTNEVGGGKQFAIQWLSTTQVPFHATRGLRNSLNGNREVKIARDGTEVEQWVGGRLLQLFHPR